MVQLILYGVLALGVVTFVTGGLNKYNSAITREVETKVLLTESTRKYDMLLGQVSTQNTALKALVKERNDAQAIAKAALAVADKEIARNKPERDRLAALENTFKATGSCAAGEAVKEIRKGLKP